MDLCMPSGTVARSTFSRSNMRAVPQLYKVLRKASWGGLFPVGTGDEDAQSVLVKRPMPVLQGFKPRVAPTTVETDDGANIYSSKKSRGVTDKTTSKSSSIQDSRSQKKKGILDDRLEKVPLHSKYLRSSEFLNKDVAELRKQQDAMAREMLEENKTKSLSKMAAAFRARRQAKLANNTEDVENNVGEQNS
jgi:hypothetical protein